MNENPSLEYDLFIKAIVIGDAQAGASAFSVRMAENTFSSSYQASVGIDFKIQTYTIDGKRLRLQLWDSVYSKRDRSFNGNARGATLVFVLYDTTDLKALDNIHQYLDIEYASSRPAFVLIGTKCDLVGKKVIARKDGKALAERYGMLFYEVSAKTGEGLQAAIEESMRCVANKLLKPAPQAPQRAQISPQQPQPAQKKGLFASLRASFGRALEDSFSEAQQPPLLQPAAPQPLALQQPAPRPLRPAAAHPQKRRLSLEEKIQREQQAGARRPSGERNSQFFSPVKGGLDQADFDIQGILLAQANQQPQRAVVLPASEEKQVEPPQTFICPLGLTLMNDPVTIFPSGKTYNGPAIAEWRKTKNTDPETRETIIAVAPNRSLKDLIDQWVANNPGWVAAQAQQEAPQFSAAAGAKR